MESMDGGRWVSEQIIGGSGAGGWSGWMRAVTRALVGMHAEQQAARSRTAGCSEQSLAQGRAESRALSTSVATVAGTRNVGGARNIGGARLEGRGLVVGG